MSEKEAEDLSLRELVRHSLNMLEQQKKDSDVRAELLYNISGDMKVFAEQHKTHTQHIIDNAKKIFDLDQAQKTLKETQDTMNGAVTFAKWFAGIGGFAGIVAAILNWFKS